MFMTDRSMGPVEMARAVEERGFDALYLPEHTHIPTTRRTPYPMGGDLPDEYKQTLDPFVALAAAAVVTERITLGTGICLVAQRDPIVTAKEVATLDQLSAGRFTFGVGFGWNVDELADHGVAFADRRDVVRDRIRVMQALWAAEPGGYEGKWAGVAPSWVWPKPVQSPHPPVLVGGAAGPKLFAHIVDYADGWIPIGGKGLSEALPTLYDAASNAGRDPATLRVVPFGSSPTPGKLEHFAALGITEVVANLRSGPSTDVLTQLDKYAGVLDHAHAA
jgi:probable F420-dependent oxidoreductase